jgi:tetratricopeptide (TPR) repeat protein
MSDRERLRRERRQRVIWWTVAAIVLVVIVFGSRPLYHFLKTKRAEQFAASADALVRAGKWNDAAKQYHAALQLDKLNYHALAGAARLASQASRPEAMGLWEQVIKLSRATDQDREEYASLLIKNDRLDAAEKILEPLLRGNPDPKTLELAARYEQKVGDSDKATEFARLAVKRAPDDDSLRFRLAEILALSTKPEQQAEARNILWQLADKDGAYKSAAIEALASAPGLSADERAKALQELERLTPKTLRDDLLAADLRIETQPEDASRIYDEEIDRWRNSKTEDLVDLARWLNAHQQPERVLALVPIEQALQNNQLLLTRLDALASMQRWTDIDDTLTRPDLTLDPSVIESFRARAAQERGAVLDAEVHWNHAISLAGTDGGKLRFVATFAEQSRANASALKAYEQLARFPTESRVAFEGAERVSQRMGDAATQRTAAQKIAAGAPDDTNASDQLAYLNLLLGDDVEANFSLAKKLAEKYPNRLAYRVTAALGYLRMHDAGSALAQFKAPVPIDWKQTQPAWRAVYAAVLLANDRTDEAQQMIATIPLDRLNPQERALIEAK